MAPPPRPASRRLPPVSRLRPVSELQLLAECAHPSVPPRRRPRTDAHSLSIVTLIDECPRWHCTCLGFAPSEKPVQHTYALDRAFSPILIDPQPQRRCPDPPAKVPAV